jgi:hypothetical protein
MAGYSGTPLPQKLGIRPDHLVAVLGEPRGFRRALAPLPGDVTLRSSLAGRRPVDVVIVFVRRRASLERRLAAIRRRMAPDAGLWVAWPKRASGVATDVTEDVVREIALPTGLVDNKVCAIDDTWSGLRLVVRRELRE